MHAVEQADDDNDMFIGTVEVEQQKNTMLQCRHLRKTQEIKNWTEKLTINNKVVPFKLDTRADCNAMSVETFNALSTSGKLKASSSKLIAFFGQRMSPLGKIALTCEYKRQKHSIEFEIIQQDVPAILGGAACVKLGLLKRMHNIVKESDLLKDYGDLFDGLGCLPGQHHIQIDHNVTPVVHAPRRIPAALRERVMEELQRPLGSPHPQRYFREL